MALSLKSKQLHKEMHSVVGKVSHMSTRITSCSCRRRGTAHRLLLPCVEPAKLTDKEKLANFETLDRNWVQSMCAFQLVTVDLLTLSALLFFLAFTDVFVQKQLIGFALAALYFFWGCSWLAQLFTLRRKAIDYLLLGHWSFWFGCSALIYWSSLSL